MMRKFIKTIIKLNLIRSKTIQSNPGVIAYFIICIFLCSLSSIGQDIPKLTTEDLSGVKITRNECFDGKSLWGYMNGGADIYLEYGFQIMRVEEFSIDEESIKLELYKMDGPLAAFGIYSFKTFKCRKTQLITSLDCLNPFQFQILCGDFYIQLISESGSEKASRLMLDIADILMKKLDQKKLVLPVIYLSESLNLSPFEIKMLKGDLGIQEKAMDLTGCFQDIDEYQVYYAKTQVDGKKLKYYEIVFEKPEMKDKFLQNCKNKDLQIIKDTATSLLITKKISPKQ